MHHQEPARGYYLKRILYGSSEVWVVDTIQLRNFSALFFAERRLAFKAAQTHTFEQVAKGPMQVLGQALRHLHHTLLHTHTGLHTRYRISSHVLTLR